MSDESPYFTSTTKWFTQDGFKALFGRMASMLRRLERDATGRCPECAGVDHHEDPCDLASLLRELP